MTTKQITCYYETKTKGKADYSSRTYGGSITLELAEGEDYEAAYNKGWLIVRSQVLRQMAESGLTTEEERNELNQIDKTLGF